MMSRVLGQAGAPGPVSLPRWKGSSRAESGQAGKRQAVLIGWLASLLGGISPLAVPPALLAGALSLFAAAPSAVANHTFPVPSNIQVTGGNASVAISWDAVPGAGNYLVQGREEGGVGTKSNTISATSFGWGPTDGWQTGVPTRNGVTYQVRVRVLANGGHSFSAWSQWFDFTPAPLPPPSTPPASPTNLKASATSGKLSLIWTARRQYLEAVTGYDVHYTSAPDGYVLDTAPLFDNPPGFRYPSAGWVALSRTGTTASQTISGLTNGTAYRVRVRARNSAGVSDWVVVKGTPSPPPPAPPITVSFATSTVRVKEGGAVPTILLNFSKALPSATTFPLTFTRGSAESGDYTVTGTYVSSNPGFTYLGIASWATINQDADKDNETFTMSLGSLPSGMVAGSPSSVTVTIVDDDPLVNVSFAEAAMELCEGGPQKYLPELMLSRRPDRSTTIWLTGDAGTAEPHDHTYLYAGYIGIQRIPHAWHASPYAIRALPDAGKDFEQFTVEIDESRLPDGFWAVEPKKVTVTIVDDDLWGQDGCNIQPPRLSVKGDRGVEWSGGGWIDFTVSIDRDNREPFTVEYSTEDVTAVAGQDYTAKTGTLSFGPYQRSQEVRVHILDDDVEDSGETFRLVLSNPNGAVIENGVGIGTILNDDGGEVQLTAAFEHAPERHDGSAFWFDLRFNEPLGATANAPSAASFTVKNGSIDRVWKVEAGRWRLQVVPETRHDVTVTLKGGLACDAAGAVCTVDGRALSNSPTATVAGPDGALSSDATLSGLSAEAGADGSWTALGIGTFASATTSYSATVPHGTTQVRLTATAADLGATLKAGAGANLSAAASGTASAAIALQVGANALSVEVTAEDGTVKTYAVTVTRQEAPVAVSLSAAPNPVVEGSPVTVTATLAKALEEAVTIPLTVTRGTSEDGDHGSLASITLPAGGTSATGTISTAEDADGDDEAFTVALGSLPSGLTAGSASSVEVTITDSGLQQRTEPLTAAFENVPSEHDGTGFSFDLTLSEAPGAGNLPVAASFKVAPGKASVSGSGRRYTVTVTPKPGNAWKDVTVTLAGGRACAEAGAICTADGRSVSNTATATIGGPVRIRIEGAKAREGKDASLDFAVTLNRAASQEVAVDYTTADETATAGSDYTAMSGTLVFAAGETAKTISVPVLDDAIHEGREVMRLLLSNPQGAYLRKVHSRARGVITNADPLPSAWQIRFGRSVSQQVVDALQQRFSTSSSTPSGLQLTLAGETLTSDTPLEENHVLLSRLLGFESVSGQALAQGSSFSFSPDGAGAHLSFWGKGAFSSFNGIEDTITLTGDVTTALLGAEWNTQRWRAGAALSHSWGNGSYQGEGDGGDGRISSSLTGIFPYGRYALTPRLGVWATAGYGWGSLSLNPDGDAPEYNPATTLALGAVGMDGLLLDGGSEGVTLTTTADALFLKTSSEAVEGLASSEGNISRLRLGLEATRPFPLSNGASLSPSLEVGLRQDSGDAETGFGMDLGAGLSWNDPEQGITATVKGRTLLSHGAEDFQDQGLALSFSWQPTPSNRGASLSLSHAVGLPAEGGMAALLNPTAIEVLDEPNSSGERFEARLAYGFPFYNNRLTLTPAVTTALSNNSRTYGLLWSLAPYDEHLHAEPWELSLEGERQENLSSPTVDHSLKLRFALPL